MNPSPDTGTRAFLRVPFPKESKEYRIIKHIYLGAQSST